MRHLSDTARDVDGSASCWVCAVGSELRDAITGGSNQRLPPSLSDLLTTRHKNPIKYARYIKVVRELTVPSPHAQRSFDSRHFVTGAMAEPLALRMSVLLHCICTVGTHRQPQTLRQGRYAIWYRFGLLG